MEPQLAVENGPSAPDSRPMEARETFEDVAELYGEVRQGYPAALFDDLVAMGALGPASRVLEVGCGAGQATGDLARRAGGVVALDPGAQLIEGARARVPAANTRFVVSGRDRDNGQAPTP